MGLVTGVEAQVRARQGLPRCVLCRFGTPERAHRKAKDRPTRAAYQCVECSPITGLSPPARVRYPTERSTDATVAFLTWRAFLAHLPQRTHPLGRVAPPCVPAAVTAPGGLRLHR